MRNTVATLPISPNETPHMGLCIMPLLMELLGGCLDMQKVIALNIRGLKYDLTSPQSEKVRTAQNYLSCLTQLGISSDYVWRDDLNEFAIFAQNSLTELLNKNILRVARKSLMRCDCGKVEYLKEATNLSQRRRLFVEESGKKICKLCKGEVHLQEKEVCLFRMQMSDDRALALPAFANEEFRHMVRSFIGVDYLVSRSRVTHFSLNLLGLQDFDIDPDFLWSLMLPYLQSRGYLVKLLVASRKNMLACLTICAVAHVFDCEDPTFIFPPYIVGPKKSNVRDYGPITQMIEQFGQEAMRAFIISGLNWKITEGVADITYLKHLSSCKPDALNQAILSILPKNQEEIIKLSGYNLNRVLKAQKGGYS